MPNIYLHWANEEKRKVFPIGFSVIFYLCMLSFCFCVCIQKHLFARFDFINANGIEIKPATRYFPFGSLFDRKIKTHRKKGREKKIHNFKSTNAIKNSPLSTNARRVSNETK